MDRAKTEESEKIFRNGGSLQAPRLVHCEFLRQILIHREGGERWGGLLQVGNIRERKSEISEIERRAPRGNVQEFRRMRKRE